MLLNSIHLKSLFDVEKNNIRVFIRDVSYSSFLLFLKLIDNLDIIINQIKKQTFLDILIIISILDIKKSKERNELIKELLRSLLYGINRVSFDFDLDNEYINFFNYNIKRSIMRDLLVFFLELVYFEEKTTRLYILIKKGNNVSFGKNLCLSYENFKKKFKKIK
ncbi:hypothetical protein CWI36_1986p0010 [Hamiltosporidium magnivora]|uniref:Uncharacterized protein n=1 Tax=Hamiltosporidium magnivora TaxID=148818 RepID=A0A4Q9KXR5_9MICR|nr:hypothetical protein CWI36_2040p0010 [Hamiltosporidium magnivora]TBT99414.1 hypothetical protein CWI36_1986p0010 [Hamiltosporidium magnivora]